MRLNITSLLRDKGYKVTPQRLAIYDVLAANKEHPSVEMIFSKLQPMYPTISLATVYKTIEILEDIGLIQILNAGEDSFRYDADTSEHPHIRCAQCNRVDDLHGIDQTLFIKTAAEMTDYKIKGQQFYFYGICPACQSAQEN